MSTVATRIVLLTLFLVFSYFIWQKERTSLIPTTRKSRWHEHSTATLVNPHLGKLSTYEPKTQQLFTNNTLLEWLNFEKKINTYYFTFYNWYFFQIQLVDLGYESYIQFRSFSQDHLYDKWSEKAGFNLDDGFYPRGGKIKIPRQSGQNCSGCCGKEKGLNFDYSNNYLTISVRQHTVKNLSSNKHDGYQYSRFWYYTPNVQLDDPSNDPFKSDLTITRFNISYKGEDRNIQANLTHVLRHNQCFSAFDQENQGVFKHSCYGGYGNGKIFMDRKILHAGHINEGRWVKSAYNLDNNRTRTYFIGQRSTHRLSSKVGGQFLPKTNWHWRSFTALMHCFSKPEYYSKHENIEKQRYIGMHLSRPFASHSTQNFEDYVFFNGKIHPLYNIDYSFSEKYQTGKNITFKGMPSTDKWQPDFEANFSIIAKQVIYQNSWLSQRNQIRAYGYWSGYVDEGVKGERVEFFNISGYIDTTNSIY